MYELAAGKMSETSAIAESSGSILFLPLHCRPCGRCFFPFSAWFRLREGKCWGLRSDGSSFFPGLVAKIAPCSEIAWSLQFAPELTAGARHSL